MVNFLFHVSCRVGHFSHTHTHILLWPFRYCVIIIVSSIRYLNMSIDLEHSNYMKKEEERIGCGYKFGYCLIYLEEMVFQFISLTVNVNNESDDLFFFNYIPPFFVNIPPLFFLSLIFVILSHFYFLIFVWF